MFNRRVSPSTLAVGETRVFDGNVRMSRSEIFKSVQVTGGREE